jgi:hypothetical protein
MSTAKEDALQEIAALARHNGITLAEIARVLTNAQEQAQTASRGILSKLFGYIGAIFVFSGICAFISMFWDDMGSAPRVIITLGTGFIAFLMGLSALTNEKYARAATPLFLIAAFLQPGGIFVMLDEYSSGGDPRLGVMFMAAFMVVQQGAAFIARQRTVLAFSTIAFSCAFFGALFDLMDISGNTVGVIMGASLLCVSWALSQSRHTAISPFWYFVGSVSLLFSFFDIVENTPFEMGFLGLSAFLVFVSTWARSRTLLLISTLAMIGYIGYFTAEHFANTLSWPVVLIVMGLVLIGFGSAAVKLNNKYIKRQG